MYTMIWSLVKASITVTIATHGENCWKLLDVEPFHHRLKTLRNGIGNAIHCNGIDTVSRKYDVMYIHYMVRYVWIH